MERLSGLDARFLSLETPTHHMHVALTMIFDPSTVPGGYSFGGIRRAIGERIPDAPAFRRRLVEVPFRLGHPVWVDDPDFDIDRHVRVTAVPAPGGLRQLAELAGDITGRRLDRTRPLWEMWVVEGLTDGRIGIIAKMHHSTVDGDSGAALLSTLFDLEPDPPAQPPPHQPDPDDRVPSGLQLVSQALGDRPLRPLAMAADLVRTGQKALGGGRVRRSPGDRKGRAAALPPPAPRTSFNGPLGRRRTVALSAIGVRDVERLEGATGTTVDDVVLAVCTGALRSYLVDGNELPDRPLVAVVPVVAGARAGGRPDTDPASARLVELPANLDDPIDRLMAIHEGTRGAEGGEQARGADTPAPWAGHSAATVLANAARAYSAMQPVRRRRPAANLVVTSIPGPDFPLYLGGAELTACAPLGPVLDGMGGNITVMSYRGVLYWGIQACPKTITMAWRLADAVPHSLDELLAGAGLAPADYRWREAADAVRAAGCGPERPGPAAP